MARRDLTERNMAAALRELGYDPERADWPQRVGSLYPTIDLVDQVIAQLGRSPSSRLARDYTTAILVMLARKARTA